jgi:hypothetical protein
MPNKIERYSSTTEIVTATASSSTSPKIPFGASAGGMIVVDAVSGGASSLSWRVACGPDASAIPVNDGTSDVATSIVAGKAYPIPDALFAAPFIVAVANAGTATFRICVKG